MLAKHALGQLESKLANDRAYDIATVHAYRADAAAALSWPERAYQQGDSQRPFLKVDPLLAGVRSEPPYQALMKMT